MYTLIVLFFSCLIPLHPGHHLINSPEIIEEQASTPEFTPVHIVTEYVTEKKGKRIDNQSGGYTMVFSGSRYAMVTGTGTEQAQVIMDFEARTITTVTKDKKGEISAVKMPMMRLGKSVVRDLVQTIESTEDVRTILGYDTRKYIITNDGDVTEAWLANVPGIDWSELAEALLTGKNNDASNLIPQIDEMPNAFALESHTSSNGGKKITHSYVRELALGADADLSALEIPAGAQVQDLTSLMKF